MLFNRYAPTRTVHGDNPIMAQFTRLFPLKKTLYIHIDWVTDRLVDGDDKSRAFFIFYLLNVRVIDIIYLLVRI